MNQRAFVIVTVLIVASLIYLLSLPFVRQFDFSPPSYRICSTTDNCTIDYEPYCQGCGHYNGMQLAVNKQFYLENINGKRNCTGVILSPALSNHWSCKKNEVACIAGQCMLK